MIVALHWSSGEYLQYHWHIFAAALEGIYNSIGGYLQQHWRVFTTALEGIYNSIGWYFPTVLDRVLTMELLG